LYGLTDININKVAPSALTGISSDILMIGGVQLTTDYLILENI
jgi:hypothetical protein